MIGDRKIILIISDDEENRLLGQQSYLRGKRVLTSTCENGWDNVCRYASRLYAVFMDIDDYEKGLAISLLAVKTGAHYIGLIAETVPDLLDEAIFSVNGALVSLTSGEEFLLSDGRRRNWSAFLRSFTTEGPIIISAPVR